MAGCSWLPRDWAGVWDPLAEARELFAAGRFEEALSRADAVLRSRPNRFGDEALFLKGLVLVDAANPGADLRSGLEAFREIGRRFPESPLREDADRWASMVRETLETRRRAAAVSERARALKERLERKETVCRSREDKVQQLLERIDRLQDRIQALESRMEEMKRVDMELEKQKQRTLP